jgi:hypothetical protein
MRILTFFLITNFLAACSMTGSPESPMWHETASMSEKIAYFGEKCRGFGFKEGTDDFSNCMMQTEAASRAQANARMRAVIQNNKPKNCTTTVTGSSGIYTGNTTCY